MYNASKSIKLCLDSILRQNFDDYEVVIINDGSTDDSESICRKVTNGHDNVFLYTFENGGVGKARRRGIQRARGDFLIFVDVDDFISPDLLNTLAGIIEFQGDVELIRYHSNLINDDEHKNHQRYNSDVNLNIPMTGLDALRAWTNLGKKYALYWLFAFKRELFDRVTPMPELRCYEDVAYIPLLIASANMVISTDYVGYNYVCDTSDSLTNSQNIDKQRTRAYDFYYAYVHATKGICNVPNVNVDDMVFFTVDYRRRLASYFDSLPESLKDEFTVIYNV
jgi:capsular polysaccharide biosynthesis protein